MDIYLFVHYSLYGYIPSDFENDWHLFIYLFIYLFLCVFFCTCLCASSCVCVCAHDCSAHSDQNGALHTSGLEFQELVSCLIRVLRMELLVPWKSNKCS